MSTAIEVRRNGLGFGTDGIIFSDPTATRPRTVFSTPPIFNSPSANSPSFVDTWLGPLLAGAEKTVSNIFSPAATSVAQAQGQYSQQGQYPVYQGGRLVGYSNTPGGQLSSSVGGFLQQIANSFGVTTTTVLLVGGVGVYLLFRPPPGRRNPARPRQNPKRLAKRNRSRK